MQYLPKIILSLSTILLFQNLAAQDKSSLDPCPNSPNCVSTLAKKRSKKMEPLQYDQSVKEAMADLKLIISKVEGSELLAAEATYLHYAFHTKRGNFIDDVEFLLDSTAKVIHFRSASRVGYGDFGANKRRMKKISKSWFHYQNAGF
jgi:uncharacterized protein (DUF1499 family)